MMLLDLLHIGLLVGGTIAGGALSGIVVVAVLKTDMKWIIINQEKMDKRISKIEERIV